MKRILVAHDGSKISDKALKQAIEIAIKFDSELCVLSVVPELYLTELSDIDRAMIEDALRKDTERIMKRAEKKLKAKPLRYETIVQQGDPAEKILEVSKKKRVNLIVTGSHGRAGASRFLLGSVSSKVVEHAHCSVLVVK